MLVAARAAVAGLQVEVLERRHGHGVAAVVGIGQVAAAHDEAALVGQQQVVVGAVQVGAQPCDDGLQLEWTLGGWDLIAVRQFGATKADGAALRFTGSVQRDDTGEVSAVEIVARGRHEEIDFGDAEPGEDTEHKITTALTYYKLSVDGEVLVEIDLLNFVYIVDGDDRLAEHRKALGI